MRCALFLFSILIAFHIATGQTRIQGIVLDQDDEPIAFAHIGIPEQSIGTASFEDGSFSLNIPEEFLNAQLKVSAIGFDEVGIDLSRTDLTQVLKVRLREKITQLEEVVVSGKSARETLIFKTEKSSKKGTVWFGDSGGGTEILTKISLDNGLYRLNQVKLRIGRNNVKNFKIRFNFYDVSDTGEPGERLIEESFIAESGVKKGLIEIDLGESKIWAEGDFFMGFEWIISAEQRENQLATRINWTDYGAPADLGKNTLSTESGGKRLVIRSPEGEAVKEIQLTKKQRKEIQAKYDARQVTYLDMSGGHGSLYKVRSYASYRSLTNSPYLEIFGYVYDQED
ncbi:MAG: carboxypeptidase-like regulatory domain-containing protein [Roseivirga sp.]|nr:carboxypeptidase-like regulatory domain-containing protein [Roseivirga sp.]